MFDFFQANRARAAAVLNEFGGVEGFVTMKDVLKFIFGEISGDIGGQEHYLERDDNRYVVPGEMNLNDFNNLTHFGLDDPRMTTIGGVAFRHLDRLPRVGDQVTVEGVVISVLEVEAHRIARVRVEQGRATAAETDDDAPAPMMTLVTPPPAVSPVPEPGVDDARAPLAATGTDAATGIERAPKLRSRGA